MADVKEMPVARKAQSGDERLQWTPNKKVRAGDEYQLAGHHITVERIVEVRPEYVVALVSVGEPLLQLDPVSKQMVPWPPLQFDGLFGRSER